MQKRKNLGLLAQAVSSLVSVGKLFFWTSAIAAVAAKGQTPCGELDHPLYFAGLALRDTGGFHSGSYATLGTANSYDRGSYSFEY
jgi:hypothetical protein